MKLCIKIFTAAIAISQGAAFQTQQFGHQLAADRSSWRQRSSPLFLSTPSDDDVLRIMKEESMDPATLAESAERMKSMTPEDMAILIDEMEKMPGVQKEQLKKMGMDPDTMLISMKMMKENPQMMATAQKLMANMTPEEMLEQSKVAQEKMAGMTKAQLEEAAEMAKKQMESISPDAVDEAIKGMKQASATKPMPDGVAAGSALDPNVIDAMYKIGEMMSQPPSGQVTFQAFATLPPITTLLGDREQDLSKAELAECWADGSMGAVRVDRTGFERVWKEVQEYFEEDIMDEARRTCHAKVKKSRSTEAQAEVVGGVPPVGAALTEDQMKVVNEQVKNMSDEDMTAMLEGMANIGPEEEARMRAMGADPEMMKKAANQMLKASQQAQKQMAGMSKEDLQKAMENMK
ncbi:hypothetical protein ACHAWO_004118 [Cyclotella atomus]|uniref:STI1 domain-containing protein n=1 Tax=Cyclotella atomus TaxID=382360 RepID=A0ABD3N9S7_9STRA